MEIDTTPITLQGDEIVLRGLLQVPQGGSAIKPVVIIYHGLTAHHAHPLLEALSGALLEAGNIVLRMDFIGHGTSGGRMKDMTISKEVAEAEIMLAYAQELPQHGPITIVGHSQGGVVALAVAARHPEELGAVVLLAPGVNIIREQQAGRFINLTFDLDNIPETIQFDGLVFGRDYILDSPAHDPFANIALYNGPMTIILGDEDRGIPVPDIQELQACSNGAQLQIIPRANHDFVGYEEEVGQRVVAYLKETLA